MVSLQIHWRYWTRIPVALTVRPTQSSFISSTRALILRAVQATGWIIGGPDGAAARLGLKRTTLIAKMKKLGIVRPNPGRRTTTPLEVLDYAELKARIILTRQIKEEHDANTAS